MLTSDIITLSAESSTTLQTIVIFASQNLLLVVKAMMDLYNVIRKEEVAWLLFNISDQKNQTLFAQYKIGQPVRTQTFVFHSELSRR